MRNESKWTKAAKNEAIIAKSMTKRLVDRDRHRATRVTPVARAKRGRSVSVPGNRVGLVLTDRLDCQPTSPGFANGDRLSAIAGGDSDVVGDT